jgi:hypothetical protein
MNCLFTVLKYELYSDIFYLFSSALLTSLHFPFICVQVFYVIKGYLLLH